MSQNEVSPGGDWQWAGLWALQWPLGFQLPAALSRLRHLQG